MQRPSQLWLIRHAPVDGPRGIIHDIDAPADVSDQAALSRLRSALPNPHVAVASPARRARETATALGLVAGTDPAFGEQDFGRWTGRTHEDIRRDAEAAYDAFWRAPASNKAPDGESFSEQIARVRAGIAALPAGDVILVAHVDRRRCGADGFRDRRDLAGVARGDHDARALACGAPGHAQSNPRTAADHQYALIFQCHSRTPFQT